MAFRLQSAIAGAGKKLSEKMTAFDENYAETLKNSAANIAREAANIRKERMIAVRDYKSKGQILMDDYGLSEAQVQTLLQGGLDRYDKFLKDVESGALQHLRSGKKDAFNQNDYIQQTLFTTAPTKEGGTAPTYMSLDEQADLFGKTTVPSTIDLGVESATVAAGTQRGIFKMDPTTVRAALGDVGAGAEQYEGPGFTPTGVSYTPPALSATTQLAFETATAEKEATEVGTKLNKEKITSVIQDRTLSSDEARRAERLLSIKERADARVAAAELLNLELLKQQTNAIVQSIENDKLNSDILSQKLKVDMETGLENARLSNDLLRAQIIDEGTVGDAKELWATSVSVVDQEKLKLKRLELDGAPDELLTKQQQLIDAAQTIADDNWELVMGEDKEELFSKVNLDTSFDRRVKQAAVGFNVSLEFSSFDEAIQQLGQGQLPAFLTASNAAIEQMVSEYGDFTRGKEFNMGKMKTLNNQLIAYSNQTTFKKLADVTNLAEYRQEADRKPIDFGVLEVIKPSSGSSTLEISAFESMLNKVARSADGKNIIAKPGDIVRAKTASGVERIYMWGLDNNWIGY